MDGNTSNPPKTASVAIYHAHTLVETKCQDTIRTLRATAQSEQPYNNSSQNYTPRFAAACDVKKAWHMFRIDDRLLRYNLYRWKTTSHIRQVNVVSAFQPTSDINTIAHTIHQAQQFGCSGTSKKPTQHCVWLEDTDPLRHIYTHLTHVSKHQEPMFVSNMQAKAGNTHTSIELQGEQRAEQKRTRLIPS